MNLSQSLQNSELFSGISEDHLREIIQMGYELSLDKGETLFFEGDKGQSFFVLISGSIKLYRNTEDGREVIVRILSGGEIFGEVILFVNETYPVSSIALEKTALFSIPKKAFHHLMEKESFRNDFIMIIMKKQRYLSNRIHYLSAYDVEERFFKFLLENYGEKEIYTINLSKKDFAAAIGTIPETFSRMTARLKKRGIIKWEKRELKVRENFWEDFE
ncbi:MAG: Crp/Fnr family transcriptional regulator [Spirochaetaceae bacterium]|jgi:CRP-like cAMP-binding protein|nr:Crp/Fnr family transcriptional regulator [Spirochaetaceae bacterium]